MTRFGLLPVCIILASGFISLCFISLSNASNFAPTWLREGTYVKYTTNQVGYAYVANNSNPLGSDTLSFWNATFGWRCISINDTIAKLSFTLNYTGKELNKVSLDNATLQLTGEVYVDLSSRAVYDLNGSLLGTTHMWVSANPSEGQEVVVWDVPPDKVGLPAKCNGIWFTTIQGRQDGFSLEGTGKINGVSTNFLILCDQDTGLMIDGNFGWDPLITSAGINALLLNGIVMLSDTNIALGPTSDPTNWPLIIMLATLPTIAFIGLFVIFYKYMHKKHKNRKIVGHIAFIRVNFAFCS
ncbi:hypothetical protein G4O51_01605 [Candidatus Bathyarchaeota archaeon A05DMB-2]|nr:hypothetical protein [Candidatus Bathyarchaeota archaeon A05DMB-2]